MTDAILSDPLFHRKARPGSAAEVLATAKAAAGAPPRSPFPLLLIHGGADRMVFPDGTRAFFAEVGQSDKWYLEYPGAYHALFADLDRDRVLGDLRAVGWSAAK